MMNKTVLGALIKSKVDLVAAATPEGSPVDRVALFEAIADAVITHITTAATITVTVASVSGVTVGPGVSGPGVGTATIA